MTLLLSVVPAARWVWTAEPPQAAGISELPIDDYDRDHWAFWPLRRPSPPDQAPRDWARNPIDLWIGARLREAQIAPLPEADRYTLLRRLKFDLIGLPPTPAEIERFCGDASPGAYERLVERLLASPGYGERWAQHWLDLARFAETDGFEHDKVRPDAWRYRQWVIDALNDAMPYDRFVELQLTGDLKSEDRHAVATMFCVAGPDMPDINEQDLRRHDKLNEITGTVGSVLLGLTMQCAQCHDHKYDPISQADFYRLRAVFEAAVPPLRRDRPLLQLARQPAPVSPFLYARGELSNRGPRVAAQPPRVLCGEATRAKFADQSPREAFAEWLFAEGTPLTARVIANRIWQYHFGRSLCGNPSDLGVIADPPSHPELLDWMACELRDHGWDLKHLHRLIVLSSTYRQLGDVDPREPQRLVALQRARRLDTDNELYSRYPRRRLSGELIRDALLAVSGQLDRRYGGSSVMPPLPPELVSTLLKGQWKTSPDRRDHVRRSIYTFARRNLRYPVFDVFDRPDAGASCALRAQSTTALQALQMLNSELSVMAARRLATRLLRAEGSAAVAADDGPQILKRLVLRLLGRPASQQELADLQSHWATAGSSEEALATLTLALLNTSEFVYVD
jgi:hypothetical protein